MNGEERIEEVGEADAQSLRGQPEEVPVAVEGEGRARGRQFEAGLVVPEDELLTDPPVAVPIGEGGRLGAVPGELDDLDRAVGDQASDACARRELLKLGQGLPPVGIPARIDFPTQAISRLTAPVLKDTSPRVEA